MYTKELLETLINSSTSLAEILRKLGKRPVGGNYKTLNTCIKKYNLETNHLTGRAWNCGKTIPKKPVYSIKEILVEDSPFRTPHKLKIRLIKEGYKEHRCEMCNLEEWNKKPISLELHHKNGINTDNRLENILIICPNCHSQTSTYRGKNQRRSSALSEKREVEWRKFKEASPENPTDGNLEPSLGKQKSKKGAETKHAIPKVHGYCGICNKELHIKNRTFCSYECSKVANAKNIPPKEEILEAFKKLTSFLAVGKYFGVSDNAVRKWCKRYNIMDMVKK